MGKLITIATCSLNQWALDFSGNKGRIIESIRRSKAAGACLRVGPELETIGYTAQDHHLEGDSFLHSWQVLADIIDHPDCQDILCDVGAPVRHRNVRYNCRILFLNRKILLIRPKQCLADDGNFRESRFFTPWLREKVVEDYYLESTVGKITGQAKVPIGDAVISTLDTSIGCSSCEEALVPLAPHLRHALAGIEIFCNSSGSHFELRKIHTRLNTLREATRVCGGAYLYSNMIGCDGDRLYYDGCAMIVVNGKVIAMGPQFSLSEVNVLTATFDLEDIRSFKSLPSHGQQAQKQDPYTRIDADIRLGEPSQGPHPDSLGPSNEIPEIRSFTPEEEIANACSHYLWDYLRRCGGASGFFIPLSGGIDSCATSVIVFGMCRIVYNAIHSDTDPATRDQVLSDCIRICAEKSSWVPSSPQEICNKIFHTCFMGTVNSSKETRSRAKKLAEAIGAYHCDLNIDTAVSAMTTLFTTVTGMTPKFKVHGGSYAENQALQNVQARLRMVTAYLFASLLPTVRRGKGYLLVLGSANVDEQLRGYLTKYDCSSADINPIGGISKTDLKSYIDWASTNYDLPILQEFLSAVPTAELEPLTDTYTQSDEADMGMTYAELSIYGRLRKVSKCGMWSMYEKLVHIWGTKPSSPSSPSTTTNANGNDAKHTTAENVHAAEHQRALSPREVAAKVLFFYKCFNGNRHKQTVSTPSLHLENYSPDDNRFDLRPFLYPPVEGSWQAKKIEEDVARREQLAAAAGKEDKKTQ